MSGGGTPARLVAALLLCAGLAFPPMAVAQSGSRTVGDEPPFAWVLIGVDVVQEHWRGAVRVGHLGDIRGRILLGEVGLTVNPALQVLVGHVEIASRDPAARRAALTRVGAAWLRRRGRVAVENRLLVEIRSAAAGTAWRGRGRLRISTALPEKLPVAAIASIEVVASGGGLIENRLQMGGVWTAGPLTVEGYWLQRRLRLGARSNGAGLTVSWRLAG